MTASLLNVSINCGLLIRATQERPRINPANMGGLYSTVTQMQTSCYHAKTDIDHGWRMMITKLLILTLLAAAAFITGAYAQSDDGQHATAVLKNAAGEDIGVARFTEDGAGVVLVNVSVEGLSPGYHGIHIHEKGDCTPPFAAAGGHYNPLGKQHGLNNTQGPHAGDLPDLKVNRAGTGQLNITTDRVTLSPGPTTLFDADGSAIIIHAGPDDQMTDPAGNSGDRIACGVIRRS